MAIPVVVHHVLNILNQEDESSSTSSDPSDEDDEIMSIISCLIENESNHQRYLGIIDAYNEKDFWNYFRMSRMTFNKVLTYLEKAKFRDGVIYHGGFQPMTIREMLLILLCYLGNQESIGTICNMFGRTPSSIWLAIGEICKFFFEKQSDFIIWPTPSEIPNIAKNFEEIAGFPGVIGVVDGCHFKIHPPEESNKTYLNCQKYYSLNVIVVALPNRTFSYAFTGFPGSCHDLYVFQRSSLYSKLEETNDMFNYKHHHLIGDSAFPLKDWLIVPYKIQHQTPSTLSHQSLNRKLSLTRVVVQHALNDLKSRFRRCQDIYASIDRCVQIITTSFVLHNICVENGDLWQDHCVEVVPECDIKTPPIELSSVRAEKDSGVFKRDVIRKMIGLNVSLVDHD